MKRSAVLLLPAVLALGLAACGGDDDGGSSSGGGDSDWCDLARQVEEQDNLLQDVDFTDPDAMKAAFDQATSLMARAADVAPDEIKADVETTMEAFGKYQDALEAADYDIMKIDTAAFDEIGTEAETAGNNISKYNEEVCGIAAEDSTGTADTVSDEGSATTDAASTATMPASGTINDMLVDQFTAMGMTEDEAQCLVDNIDIAEFSQNQDTSQIMDAFGECGIDPTKLGG